MAKSEVVAEVKKQLWLAGPLIASNVLQYLLQVISIMFVGHLGELQLAGASMASSFTGVTGFSLLLGMGTALETWCGQAFGAKEYHMLGVHMQMAMLVLLIVSIPLAFLWVYTGHIFRAIKQDQQISMEAGLYARWMIPSVFAWALIQCLTRFLQCQNIVLPLMMCSGATALLHILVCWLMVFKSGLGNRGAALAISISNWINVLLLVLYVKFSPFCKSTWTGFTKTALHNVKDFVKLAIPSACMICLAFWSLELIVLLSGLLPNPKLKTSVVSISLNTATLVSMIPMGLGSSISTRISNELGAGHPEAACLAVYVAATLALLEGLLMGTIIVLVRGYWAHAYSNDGEVVKHVAAMMPLLALSHFLDAIQCVVSGTVRGCGWQKIGAFINLGSYYTVGIPSSVVLAFVFHIGEKGLWIGIICALFVQVVLFITIILQTNWQKEAMKAQERVNDSNILET